MAADRDIELRPINQQQQQPDDTVNRKLTWCERVKLFSFGRFKNTSISTTILLVWLLIETLVCVVVLNSEAENHIENFLRYLCDKEKCPTLLGDLLYWRILVSSVSIAGILVGYSSIASIWVLMNALGLSPLFPVVFSWFYEYKTLKSTMGGASVAWKVVKFIYRCLLPEL